MEPNVDIYVQDEAARNMRTDDGKDGTHPCHLYTYNPSHPSHVHPSWLFLFRTFPRGFIFRQSHLSQALLSLPPPSLPVERVDLRGSQGRKNPRHKMVLLTVSGCRKVVPSKGGRWAGC